MNPIQKVLYTAKVRSTSGGRSGEARSNDGRLNLKFSTPGTSIEGTNPEQVFAAGWAACFTSALWLVAKRMNLKLPSEMSVDMEVDLGQVGEAFDLQARLKVHLPSIDPETSQKLVDEAHMVCPYSRATRGNIRVETHVDAETALKSA